MAYKLLKKIFIPDIHDIITNYMIPSPFQIRIKKECIIHEINAVIKIQNMHNINQLHKARMSAVYIHNLQYWEDKYDEYTTDLDLYILNTNRNLSPKNIIQYRNSSNNLYRDDEDD